MVLSSSVWDIDICGISEHWLLERDSQFLFSIHSNFTGISVSDTSGTQSGRNIRKGGVALLLNKKHNNKISQIELEDDRLIGIQLQLQSGVYVFIIQVYLPSSNNGMCVYNEYIEKLDDIIHIYTEKGKVIILGDFSAHLQSKSVLKQDDRRSRVLCGFLTRNNLTAINTLPTCRGAHSSFVSYDGKNETLIDHILLPSEMLDLLSDCEILDDCALNVSNHRPLECRINVPPCFNSCSSVGDGERTPIKWNKVTSEEIGTYKELLSDQLSPVLAEVIPSPVLNIDYLYVEICKAISTASNQSFKKANYRPFLKPYWNDQLKNLHYTMRVNRRDWIRFGRPRDISNTYYVRYKDAKRKFRHYHRHCAEQYLRKLNDEIDTAAELDSGHFWKLINKRKNRNGVSNCTEMKFNDIMYRDPELIAKHWGRYYSDLYKDTNCHTFDSQFHEEVNNSVSDLKNSPANAYSLYPFLPYELSKEIGQLKSNKACGPDSVYNEHIKYGDSSLHFLLLELYNLMFKYSYIPKDMKRGIIVTLFKGGRKKKDEPSSYRAITLSSAILKLYERLLLSRIYKESDDRVSPLQGGFQKGMGCIMSSFLLKECVYYSKDNGSKLYLCFLDVKTAFDKV